MQIGFLTVAQNAFFNEKHELTMEKIVSGISAKGFPAVIPLMLCFSLIGSSITPPGEYIYAFSVTIEGSDKSFSWNGSWTKPEADLLNLSLPIAQKLFMGVQLHFSEPGLYTITLELDASSKSHSFYVVDAS